ncbi:MAG: ASCH domain-containing protein [Candidatus Micrarchaeia archaeon]
MKALSIKQPWAELILQGRKKIEIRTWNTKLRGYFLIHVSKGVAVDAANFYKFDLRDLTVGHIVGYANLVDVIHYGSEEEFVTDRERHLSIDNNTFPTYGFVLKDVQRIAPIPYKGKLGFFDVPEIRIENLKANSQK